MSEHALSFEERDGGEGPVMADERPEAARSRNALAALGAALALGLLGQTLLKALPWGINVMLWIGSLLIAALLLLRGRDELRGDGRWLALPAFAFAAALAVRDSATLVFFSVVAVVGSLALAMSFARRGGLARSGLWRYAISLVVAAVNAFFYPLLLLTGDIRWRELPQTGGRATFVAVLRGLAIALPLLLLFGALLALADARFDRILSELFNFDIERVVGDTIGTIFWTWLVVTFLRALLVDGVELGEAGLPPGFLRLGAIEMGLVLGLLNLLFLAFVIVQAGYFFGGEALIAQSAGLSYAEYARRGFFELVTVAALVIGLLLTVHWLRRPDDGRVATLFRWLAAGMITLLFVIMASALHRMWLYFREFGLTELRLYTTAFMGWLAFLFVWFAATVLRGRRERFAVGALATAFVALALLVALNPDALIARVNLARGAATVVESGERREVDGSYLTSLSAAAVPPIIAGLDTLSPDIACETAWRLLNRWGTPERDWRSWNWDRMQAERAVAAARPTLEALACAPR